MKKLRPSSPYTTKFRRRSEQIHKLNRILAVLSDVNQSIVRIRHLPSLYEKICQIAVETGGFKLIWIGLIDPSTQRITLAAHAGVGNYHLGLQRLLADDERMQRLTNRLQQT